MIPPPERRLVLVRHAKSAYPQGVPDRERPLAGRGRRNARACGEWLRAEGPRPDLVLYSDATRAAQTWEILRAGLGSAPLSRKVPELYTGRPDDVLAVLHDVPPEIGSLFVVGHEPAMSGTVLLLAGDGSDLGSVQQVAHKYRTNGVAVLHFAAADWGSLLPAHAVLESFTVPRDKRA